MNEMIGLGTKFQRESATAGTFVDIANVVSITPPQISMDDVEIEDLGNVDGYKEFMAGMIDPGEVSLTLNFSSKAGHLDLLADMDSRAKKNYKIILPDGFEFTFSGYVKGFSPQEVTQGDIVQAEVTIKVSGKPSLKAV